VQATNRRPSSRGRHWRSLPGQASRCDPSHQPPLHAQDTPQRSTHTAPPGSTHQRCTPPPTTPTPPAHPKHGACTRAARPPYVKLLLRGALCLADVYGCVVDVVGQVSEGAHCGTGRYGAAQLGQVQGR
jgi:hypothetical protein